jgi:hypothetical protein
LLQNGSMRVRPGPLVDTWYGSLVPGVESFPEWMNELPGPLRRLGWRLGAVRGALMFAASTRHEVFAMIRTDPGWRSLLLLRALLGRRRKLVALQFIHHAGERRGAGRWVDRAWAPVDRWATRRALRFGQVLTAREREAYAEAYGMAPERFVLVPWPRRTEPVPGAGAKPAAPDLVVCGGRAFCDWPTLFAAARGSSWRLTVVCTAADLAEVQRLNRPAVAKVRCDLPPEEWLALLVGAAVAVVCVHEAGVSQCHVRIQQANDAAVPVVATATASLDGYVLPGETALTVAPEEPAALREAVDRVLAEPALRARLRDRAAEHSREWAGPAYLQAISDLICGRPVHLPATGRR